MLSDASKSAFKMGSEDPQKILLKSTKNIFLSGLNYQSYQLFDATFR